MDTINASTPARICLFGEHQDYLGLDVIAMAISLRIQITLNNITTGSSTNAIIIHHPDLEEVEHIAVEYPLVYTKDRDYYKSVLNVLHRKGIVIDKSIEITVTSTIPINAGCSSSSALIVCFITFLKKLLELDFSTSEIAEIAYAAEVLEFGEPGGMMDQYSTAVGDIILLSSQPINVVKYSMKSRMNGVFILADSLEPKETLRILARVKYTTMDGIKKIKSVDNTFNLSTATQANLDEFQSILSNDEYDLIKANISDRDILLQARQMFENAEEEWSDVKFGKLLNDHFYNLKNYKQISTVKIDKMVEICLENGAWGAKINGSGGGGCMFCYIENNVEKINAVKKAIEELNAKVYVITTDEGTK